MVLVGNKWEHELKTERNKRLQAEMINAPSYEQLIHSYAKSKVSRKYKNIVETVGCPYEVVWGIGGGQTKRMKELDRLGITYIHIVD